MIRLACAQGGVYGFSVLKERLASVPSRCVKGAGLQVSPNQTRPDQVEGFPGEFEDHLA